MDVSVWDPVRLAHPWFAGISDLVARIDDEPDWPSIETLNERFADELAGVGVHLVESGKTKATLATDGTIDPASLYEVRIIERGEIPTRARNAHDLLNTLIWAAFPHAKLALSRSLAVLQRERAAGRARLPATRTPEHDRLALVDEGAVLRTPSRAWIFGHAILEHAYAGELGVRGTVIELGESAQSRPDVDRLFAAADLARVVRRGPGVAVTELV
ncbi:MAG: DUF3025 domain-containing protein [Kofleriaceae bacterium]|nr:DUF3025 domain-containing protein [Kofleriaceae bacterium]